MRLNSNRAPAIHCIGTLLIAVLMASSLLAAPPQAESRSSLQDPLQIYQQYKPVVGEPHPDFVLPSIDGKDDIQLSKYRGKKVLLLHFASW